MKKYLLWIAVFLFSVYSYSCDICGGATSSFSLGLLPNSKHHIIGLRYISKTFESRDLHTYKIHSSENFTSSEIFARFKLSNKFQLLSSIPYIYNVRKTNLEKQTIKGLGDINLLSNYVFVDNADSLTKKVKHTGTIGLGVKLPTGTYNILGFTELNMLPGTGSFDYLANVNYSLQYRSVGLQNETSFSYKTENKYLYRFGNNFSSSQIFFYRWVLNQNLKIIPQIGLNYSHNWKDIKNRKKSEDTFNGGDILNAQMNLFISYKNWGFSSQIYLPIYQNLNQGYVTQKSTFRLSINYFISKK
ncbi:MAG: hypothetical protein V4622_00630 [Bacteroidota bacterium]